jgi:beta-xylosidase
MGVAFYLYGDKISAGGDGRQPSTFRLSSEGWKPSNLSTRDDIGGMRRTHGTSAPPAKVCAMGRHYGLRRLVYVEEYPTIQEAIAREKAMKAWKRIWKTDRISAANPNWLDLFDQINA